MNKFEFFVIWVFIGLIPISISLLGEIGIVPKDLGSFILIIWLIFSPMAILDLINSSKKRGAKKESILRGKNL